MYFTEARTQANTLERVGDRTYGNFTGLRAFMNYINDAQQARSLRFRLFRNASDANNKFYSFHNFNEAHDVFMNKPQQLVKFVTNELNLIEKDSIGNDHWMDVTGDFLDVSTFLEGDPECFGNMFMGNPKRTFVTLLLKLDVPWTTTPDYLVYYGARILRLIDWLERKEVRTRVICFSSTNIEHIEIPIKDFYEPLTLADIAIVANPDFYRRHIFAAREVCPTWKVTYGSTKEQDEQHMAIFPELTKKDNSIFMYLDRSLYENNREYTEYAFDSAEEYMIKMLAEEETRGSLII